MVEIGYLLPTRENIMQGRPEGRLLLDLARRAEDLGYDSIWVGDSLLARPRHEPMTVLAAVAGCTQKARLGTAVLLPALRNPVLLAHQAATLDQVSDGRLILGVGIAADVANIRAEFKAAGVPFEKRVGRMLEGLRLARALWSGDAVDWDGRWQMQDAILGPTPAQAGGPPIWVGGGVRAGLERAGRHFDGWFPTGPGAEKWGEMWRDVQGFATEAGRDPADLTGAIYLTLAIDEDAAKAEATVDAYLESYYMQPAAVLRKRQACFGGPAEAAADWVETYIAAGASHLVLRFAGDGERQMQTVAKLRQVRNW